MYIAHQISTETPMQNLIKSSSFVLAFIFITFCASAQKYTLDDARDDATEIVSQSSQMNGKVSSLINMMNQKKTNKNQLENRLANFDQSFKSLNALTSILSEGVNGLTDDKENDYSALKEKSKILIRHMMLFSDEVIKLRNSGDGEAGNNVSASLLELKNMAQDIRQEVIGIKNN